MVVKIKVHNMVVEISGKIFEVPVQGYRRNERIHVVTDLLPSGRIDITGLSVDQLTRIHEKQQYAQLPIAKKAVAKLPWIEIVHSVPKMVQRVYQTAHYSDVVGYIGSAEEMFVHGMVQAVDNFTNRGIDVLDLLVVEHKSHGIVRLEQRIGGLFAGTVFKMDVSAFTSDIYTWWNNLSDEHRYTWWSNQSEEHRQLSEIPAPYKVLLVTGPGSNLPDNVKKQLRTAFGETETTFLNRAGFGFQEVITDSEQPILYIAHNWMQNQTTIGFIADSLESVSYFQRLFGNAKKYRGFEAMQVFERE